MIYISHESMDPFFWFALEYEFLQEREPQDDVFLFWRTEPTLMIGSYQIAAAEINEAYAKQRGIHIVRRITGGGAIYTDPGSWQFSYIKHNRTGAGIQFEEFVQPVLNGLRAMGIDASMSERNDLLVNGKKFCGNAQYRRGDRLLHHGSILFDTDIEEMVRGLTVDDEKLITKGVRSVRQRVTNLKEHIKEPMDAVDFRDRLLEHMLTGDVKRHILSDEQIQSVQETAQQKFKSWDWNYGRSPDFQVVKSKRLRGGKIEVRMNLEKGLIADCSIHGDFFFGGDIGAVTSRLKGCPYNEQSIRAALVTALQGQSFYMIGLDELVECML